MKLIDFLDKTNNNDLKQIILDYDLNIEELEDLERVAEELEDYPAVTYKNKFYEIIIEFENVYVYYKNKIEFRKDESIYFLKDDTGFKSHGLNVKLVINSYDLVFNLVAIKNKINLFFWKAKLLK